MAIAISSPAEFPANARLAPIAPHGATATRRLLGITRPDVSFMDSPDAATQADWLLASGPDFSTEIRAARARGLNQPAFVLPEIGTSYYDYWSFPLHLLRRSDAGELQVTVADFVEFVTDLGDFFGRIVDGRHEPELMRYMPLHRASAPDAHSQMQRVLSLLDDEESRLDYATVVAAEPEALWRHWLKNLFNGLEYMDYVSLTPGSVVLNCGVHGGGEVPYFLASMAGQGAIVNADPLGNAYLSGYVHAAIAGSSAQSHQICAALNDEPGTIEMMVEPNGMAQNASNAAPDMELRSFAAMTIDDIVRDLALPRVDLIKMDIEGAEPRALTGAWRVIERFRPQLAISIYHMPEHFFELPLMLTSRLIDYRFFIRNYHFISNETILYAIPAERPFRPRRHRIAVDLIS